MDAAGQLLEIATRAGPLAMFVLMAYMWKLERDERMKLQEALLKMVSSMTAVNHTLQEFRSSLFGFKLPIKPPEDVTPEF